MDDQDIESQTASSDAPPSYDEIVARVEPPPPFSLPGVALEIVCRVCQAAINVPQTYTANVIKCNACNEVTPVRAPPLGKRFVRCPCNALLTTELANPRLKCPRKTCNRVLTIMPPAPRYPTAPVSQRRVESISTRPMSVAVLQRERVGGQCVHCGTPLQFFTDWDGQRKIRMVYTCSHCGKRSILDETTRKARMYGMFIMGIISLLASTIGLIYILASLEDNAVGSATIPGFIVAPMFLLAGFYLRSLKVSVITLNVQNTVIHT